MLSFQRELTKIINSIEPEFRVPVWFAAKQSGSLVEFQQELAAQAWDYPDLPVQDIVDRMQETF